MVCGRSLLDPPVHRALFVLPRRFLTVGPGSECRWEKLSANYHEARTTYEREMPNVIKSKELLPKLSLEAQKTMEVLRDAKQELHSAEKTGRSAMKCCELYT